MNRLLLALFASLLFCFSASAEPKSYSGIYPHLAYFNDEGECGTGAVVPWAGRLWVITYAPHKPMGSTDKLYEITPELEQIIRPESIGGTPANRMIHRESNQLFIGPYVIDAEGNVRVIPVKDMPGRITGTARHLEDPAGKIYHATMEEGLYTVDVKTLEVTEHIQDGNSQPAVGDGLKTQLPGYHGKGLYSGQGWLIYANNGEKDKRVAVDPFIDSGSLAKWDGSGDWQMIRRNQFTEVTGPGGIYGNENPESDPIWSIGWDARSLILMLLDKGEWHSFRLPKASHSYDGSHGWNTEWPRIRDIGEEDLLMTMHGTFWRFPKTFSAANTKGIAPRSNYLKVIGDFCRWQDKVVFGCDDTANKEFLNTRVAKGHVAAPQSQSNLWFVDPEQIDQLGPAIGRGAVWLNDPVEAGVASDAFLISGYDKRAIHFVSDVPTTMTMEFDIEGNGDWKEYGQVEVDGYAWQRIESSVDAVWMRVSSSQPLAKATALFHMANDDGRVAGLGGDKFEGMATPEDQDVTGGLIRARDKNERTLHFAANDADGKVGYYVLDADMKLVSEGDAYDWMQKNVAIPSREGVIEVDAASVIYIDDNGQRFRLPKDPAYEKAGPLGFGRLCREVATERDLFNCHGTFYELPANNAGGFSRVRPVSTHGLAIKDFCSYRGLFVMSGVQKEAFDLEHIIRSEDGKAALWVGAIDDVWSLGKPVGKGGPWLNSAVKAGEASDPYLMTAYDEKSLRLSSEQDAKVTAEIDISGMGDWQPYRSFTLQADESVDYEFPSEFQAYWIRFVSDTETVATAQLEYR